MPITIRAGMVKATLSINKVFIWLGVKPRLVAMLAINGAWLNQTKKVMKKAIQLMWSIFIFPLKENKLKRSALIMMSQKQ